MNRLYKCPRCGNWNTKDYGPRYEIDDEVMCESCLDDVLQRYYAILDEVPDNIPMREVDDETYFLEAEEQQ